MDIFSILGFVLSIGFVLMGIIASGDLGTFIDIPSMLIVVGGTLGSMLVSSKAKNAKLFFKLTTLVLKENKVKDIDLINNIIDFSSKARREGLLSLEDTIQSLDDPFLKKGMMMIVDGMEPEALRNVLSLKIRGVMDRHKNNRGIFDTGAALAPAFGMIGTLIGLVNMLKTLSDPSTIGPQMSVALITTFYGSLLANVFFMPISKKLKAITSEEVFQKEMILEGLLGVQAGENPTALRQKLMSYLDDKETKKVELMNEQALAS
ncbi:motility protein A [Clostridium sp. DJ247]|uniref:motility protein A n=1 Tax=Clostridium sp. DJ247 TaxID=2726188 RepID=UPI00162A3B2D|nr:MotA/TolQ/ExbB proton channel family protein [Clostridium sp. DJ247]MBC2578866.1 motility protein A [Clostridium sp. DJ247]